jgi:Mlc titration factor MtfA (ptsG expression regulator)
LLKALDGLFWAPDLAAVAAETGSQLEFELKTTVPATIMMAAQNPAECFIIFSLTPCCRKLGGTDQPRY